MNELLWISVPGGIRADGRPLLRVLVVPRLEGATLADAGMGSWPPPALLANPALQIVWREDENAAPRTTDVAPADVRFDATAGLWQRFFGAALPLEGGRTNRIPDDAPPQVEPTAQHAEAIGETFAIPAGVAFGPSPESAPPPGYAAGVQQGLAKWAGARAEEPAPRRAAREDADDAPAPPPPPGFHRTISLLREHPAVLRTLGLIFDITATPPTGLADAGQLQVAWPEPPAGLPQIVSPWTIYGAGFLPFSRSGTIVRGMVTLTPDPTALGAPNGGWTVVTVDVDGAVGRLRDAAQMLPAAGEDDVLAAGALSLPAMRTAGLQLVRVDRGTDLARRHGVGRANAARGSLDGHVLDADDLVLGYRIDVKRGGGQWRSLHERLATYHRGDPADVVVPEHVEEGHVKVGGAVRDRVGGGLRADEIVARWNGWSLAVPPPAFDQPGGVSPAAALGGTLIPFGFSLRPRPASLPALRFAETYAIRARVADMAGGGLALDDPDADRCAISEQAYRRYEPVPSPGVRLDADPAALAPGEEVDRLVIRSAPGVGVDAFPAQNPGYDLHARRSLRQPHVGLSIAEQHKMLDDDTVEQTFAWVTRALAAGDPNGADDPAEAPLPDPAAAGISALPRQEPGALAAAFARADWAEPWPKPNQPKTLELRDAAPGRPPVIWEGDTLVVRLPPGRQLTLELSSSLTADFRDHFELQDLMPPSSKQAAVAGRHPLVTPAHAVRFVHAVRQPINPPDPATRLSPQPRVANQSFALLDPDPVLLGLDVESTAQIDVTGAWTERRDDVAENIADATVISMPIDRGAVALREPLRHELGDTRHRDITYTVTAVSRFPQYFAAGEFGNDPAAFTQSRPLTSVVSIPSSARPPAPVVLAARPAFTWTEQTEQNAGTMTLRRQRLAGRLRLELARPWFVSGDGEHLGVILWNRAGSVTPPPEIAAMVTEVGRDPVWDTTDPERWPTESEFSGTAGPVASRKVAEAGRDALVVPFEAWFHNDRWYADVSLPGVASSSYCPFVRLAVARYQPDSIADHHLSPIVRADLTQVLPDRTLTVTQTGNVVGVALAGLGPAGPQDNRVEVVLEHCDPPPGVPASAIALTALTADGDAPAWRRVEGATHQTQLGAAPVSLTLPLGGGAFRVRVREVELIGAEPGVPPPASALATPGELGERVTFTDTVALPLA
jgi:hypothetical protein